MSEISLKRARNDSRGNQAVETKKRQNVAGDIMKRLGYEEGGGLGQNGEGRLETVEDAIQVGRLEFGHQLNKKKVASWDQSEENKSIEERPEYLEASEDDREFFSTSFDINWIVKGKPLKTLLDEEDFCDNQVIRDLLKAKSIFDYMDIRDIQNARQRANPYETIMGAIFQNRAAMKMANLDRVFDWKLSREDNPDIRRQHNPLCGSDCDFNLQRNKDVFYFADICAGPGGFSEYMMWRKAFYNSKGIGFTLRGKDDFKLYNFKASSQAFFETYYGTNGDGDIYNPDNIKSLEDYVRRRTDGRMCDTVMSDGGFSVEGKEEIQEILSKRIYLCQFLVGLSLCRIRNSTKSGGNFICKMFDVFTTFSAGLLYIMYLAFEKVSIHKPNTSRPGNSERYIFCENLSEFGATVLKNYLIYINGELDKTSEGEDILEIIPLDVLKHDVKFVNYLKTSNEKWASRQILYLQKYETYALNKSVYDEDQPELREKCLQYWEIPNKSRPVIENQPPTMALRVMVPEHAEYSFDFATSLTTSAMSSFESLESRMLCLLPENNPPMLLVSNGKGESFLLDSEHSNIKQHELLLPPKTLLLVQKTSIYTITDKGALLPTSDWSSVMYVIDAGWLAGDAVYECNLSERRRCINKFCESINKCPESYRQNFEYRLEKVWSIKRKGKGKPVMNCQMNSYYLIPSPTLSLEDGTNQLSDLKIGFLETNNRCEKMAVLQLPVPRSLLAENDDKNRYLSVKAVRLYQTKDEQQNPYGFFDTYNKKCVWDWIWKPDSRGENGIYQILHEEVDNFLTVPTFNKLVQKIK
ncbi:unnamed protein product [Bursaphelenchus xylophilus]|uniref:Cap-specific mRNA (nucleoside-2'-O-)-methyltransferase 1 n=1 Tax=Bursaphelenchus xylophilus TaxID=6326 RepID=A0A1I7SMU5_BURXY|nr:unnamed protein product [Bursaphelenchus xylophilus]CAG9130386.1 unnamed protein product [Bursaphelenchus xylophilus]